MALCDVEDLECIDDCIGLLSIEGQMAFNNLMDCLNGACYYLDACPVDPVEACPEQYYACFPPGTWDCALLYECAAECKQRDATCLEWCLNEGSPEGLDRFDALVQCLFSAGFYDCGEGDSACVEQAEDQCAAELSACTGEDAPTE